MAVAAPQRFTRDHPCPICGGYDQAPRGQGVRCFGFLSDNGAWVQCSRAEHAGSLALKETSKTYAHLLTGACQCGVQHGPTTGGPSDIPGSNGHRVVAEYDYQDQAGILLFQVVRYEPKRFVQRRLGGVGGWVYDLKGVPRPLPLYRLPELLATGPEAVVYVTEGEKHADRLAGDGLVATTMAMGATTSRFTDLGPLHGRPVVILPDLDDIGQSHAQEVATALHGKAASVRVVALPGLTEKGADILDWLASGHHTIEDLQELAASAPGWEPASNGKTMDGWDPPFPFRSTQGAKAFPVGALPTVAQDFVQSLSDAYQVPADLPGCLTLGVGFAAASGRCSVRLSEDWHEPLNAFLAVGLASGERKSGTLKAVAAPLEERERELAQNAAPDIAQAITERDILETDLRNKKTAAAKIADDERAELTREAIQLEKNLRESEIPKPPRLIADDATPEAVASLLAEQHGRISIISTEGGLFEMLAGRYSDGTPNLDVYLKGHSGDPIRIDRKSRPPEFIQSPALTLVLTVQPSVIQDLAERKVLRGRGLLARILYSLPESRVGYRKIEAPQMPTHFREEWGRIVNDIAKLPDPLPVQDHAITLSAEAHALFQDYREVVEAMLRPGAELSEAVDWGSKLPGAVIRIAGILHLFRHFGDKGDSGYGGRPWEHPISEHTLKAAIELGGYFTDHALAAFALMGADSKLEDSKKVWAVIERHGFQEISKRDLWQLVRRSFTVNQLGVALETLAEMGYIRPMPFDDSRGPGRNPSPAFYVNPLGRTHNTQNTHKSGSEGNSGYCGDLGYGDMAEAPSDDPPRWGEL